MAALIREELPGDRQEIRAVNVEAFGQEAEADLVDLPRTNGKLLLSLVALDRGPILGHIAYSPVTLHGPARTLNAVGLGPMAVLPALQRTGIGSALINESHRRLQGEGRNFVVVLGHPDYYPRFGFRRASDFNVRWERDCPDEASMLLELRQGSVPPQGGIITYGPEFSCV